MRNMTCVPSALSSPLVSRISAAEGDLAGHPLGLFLEGSGQPCPPGGMATLMGLESYADPTGTPAFGALLQVTEAEDLTR